MINKNDVINVFNENDGKMFTVSQNETNGYIFEKGTVEDPFFVPILWEDIIFINNRSDVFKTGGLVFKKDEQNEVYKELRIDIKNQNYFTRSNIENIILEPTVDKLKQIVKITSVSTIERFRHYLIKLDNEQEYDIAKRVYDVINIRYTELKRRQFKSNIVIKERKKVVTPQEQIDREVTIEDEEKEQGIPKSNNSKTGKKANSKSADK